MCVLSKSWESVTLQRIINHVLYNFFYTVLGLWKFSVEKIIVLFLEARSPEGLNEGHAGSVLQRLSGQVL